MMPVYVDDMYLYPMGRFGRMKMSHMVADTREDWDFLPICIGIPEMNKCTCGIMHPDDRRKTATT